MTFVMPITTKIAACRSKIDNASSMSSLGGALNPYYNGAIYLFNFCLFFNLYFALILFVFCFVFSSTRLLIVCRGRVFYFISVIFR